RLPSPSRLLLPQLISPDLGSRTSNLGRRTSDFGPRPSDLGPRTSTYVAPSLRETRGPLHRPADRGRRHGHEHRVRPLRAGLADDVWVEHVYVSAEQMGGRDS